MAINPVVEKHLNEALDELRAQRRELDAAIAEVETTLRRLGGKGGAAYETSLSRENGHNQHLGEVAPPEIAPPMKDAVVDFIAARDYDVTTAQVVEALAPKWDWKAASIRSLMSRLAKEGVIGNPRRGVYNSDPSTTPFKMSEAPGSQPGASDGDATSRAEGGDVLDDAAPHQVDPPSGNSPAGQPDDRASIERR